jgi:anti-sigma factor RsiW
VALPEDERSIHAYVDGELDADSRRAFEQKLEATPSLRTRVQDYRQINQALKSLYDPVALQSVPPALLNPASPRQAHRSLLVAAIVAALAIGGAGGWLSHALYRDAVSRALPGELASEALTAHAVYTPEVRHPVEVGGSEAHLVPWLSKRLGLEVRAPSLESLGYRLLGGRLLPWHGGTAAQLMYEKADGRRLTLYMTHRLEAAPITAFRFAERGGLRAFYWMDGEYGCALVGEIDREELSKAAHVVYEALDLGHS